MTVSKKDLGIAQVMLLRLNEQVLPYALKLKHSVDNGGLLTDYDRRFLKDAVEEAHFITPLLERQPQYQPLAHEVFSLFEHITAKALENEKASTKKG